MRTEPAIDRVERELLCALDMTRADLDRVELLAAALGAFCRPIPEYEPNFRHTHQMRLSAHEIG